MIPFTTEEREILTQHRIPPQKVLNASGMQKKQWEYYAKLFNYSVVWGASPCKAAGHRLKTRHGHCIQCKSDNLAFMRRKIRDEQLIIAYAPSVELFWLGRLREGDIQFLSELQYGGAGDWQISKILPGKSLEQVEWQFLEAFSEFAHPHPLDVGAGCLDGDDLFGCSEEFVNQVWNRIITTQNIESNTQQVPHDASKPTKVPSPPKVETRQPPRSETLHSLRCPHCKQRYRLPWPRSPKDFRCLNQACRRWFHTALTTLPYHHDALYLDIETTGLSYKRDQITTVVWWSAEEGWGHWINGEVDNAILERAWRSTRQVVTFNGKSFDEPFIEAHFNVTKHKQHIDLRHAAREQQLGGGLKNICKNLGFGSPSYLNDTDGMEAIRLWQSYQQGGDLIALKRLLHYNAWDVVQTYRLRQHLENTPCQSIEDSIPFEWT